MADFTPPHALRYRPLHACTFGVRILEALGSLRLAALLERLVLLTWAKTEYNAVVHPYSPN
jgi:hypothetical protein